MSTEGNRGWTPQRTAMAVIVAVLALAAAGCASTRASGGSSGSGKASTVKNPAQFVRLQNALAADALNEYIHHTGSAVFACPPGIRPGQHWGDGLFT